MHISLLLLKMIMELHGMRYMINSMRAIYMQENIFILSLRIRLALEINIKTINWM